MNLTDKEAKQIAHTIFCELNFCGGDSLCFNGIDEVKREMWMDAVKKGVNRVLLEREKSCNSVNDVV